MPYIVNPFTGKFDATNLDTTAGDLRYLKLDCSNDPLTAIPSISTSPYLFDGTETSLTGLWNFDEGTGTNAADSVGVNAFTLSAATWDSVNMLLGTSCAAVYALRTNILSTTTPWTIMGWFYSTDWTVANNSAISSGDTPTSGSASFLVQTTATGAMRMYAAGGYTSAGATLLIDSNWYHLTATFDGLNTYKFYINGAFQGFKTGTPSGGTTNTYLGVGFNGALAGLKVDEVAFFDTVLDESSIMSYVKGRGTIDKLNLYYPDTPSSLGGLTIANTGGKELIINDVDRNFSGAGNWTGTNWSIVDGTYTHNPIAADSATLANANLVPGGIIADRVYKITFTAVRTAGNLYAGLGTAFSFQVTASGTYTKFVTALVDNADLVFACSATFNGSIDNVSVVMVQKSFNIDERGRIGINRIPTDDFQIQLGDSGIVALYNSVGIYDADGTVIWSLAANGKQSFKFGSTFYDQSSRALFSLAGSRIDFLNSTGTDYASYVYAVYNIILGSSICVKLTGATTGKLTVAGLGNTNNENLIFDFETTANTVAITSGTGVTDLTWTGNITVMGSVNFDTTTEYINSTDAGHLDLYADTGIDFNIGATEQITLTDGKLTPTTTNDIDLGDTTHLFKDFYTYLDGKHYFGDTGVYVFSNDDGYLDLVGDVAIRLNNKMLISDSGIITKYNNVLTEGYGVPAIVDTVNLSEQTSDISATNFTNATVTGGLYRVNYYILTSVAGGTASTLALRIKWSDGFVARTAIVASLNLQNDQDYAQGVVFASLGTGAVQYETAASGIYDGAEYTLYLVCERMQ